MHEHGVVSHAVSALLDASGGRRVTTVTVAIGPTMLQDAARFAWEHETSGTVIDGAEVTWVDIQDRLRCLSCGTEFHGEKTDPCPQCTDPALVVEPAPQIAVEDWVLEGAV